MKCLVWGRVVKMASAVRAGVNWLKMAWNTQPVLVVSCVLGGVGTFTVCPTYSGHKAVALTLLPPTPTPPVPLATGPLIVLLSPGSRKSEEERLNWPTHYKSKHFVPKYLHVAWCSDKLFPATGWGSLPSSWANFTASFSRKLKCSSLCSKV